ncbi:M23 family metallopeptidase [Campylobacter sp. CX2-4080-23]|uniref:M23 family metallopeptidase n=1 Tax=Campylobacter porcelli TaxID=1660073 RepID=UPI002E9E4FAB|nr:M23 family metallopeptidase [Campylobacter sp. CX2-4080-23]
MRVVFSLLIFALFSWGNTIFNGGLEIISIESDYAGELRVNDKSSLWLDHPKKDGVKVAFIPVSYYAKNDINITNSLNNQSSSMLLKLEQKSYKKESISVAPAKANPPKDVMKRIEKERDEATQIYRTFSPNLLVNSQFISPMNSFITSQYGNTRVFNGSVKSYHGGVDYRAAIGQSVISANDGIVRIAKDRYYAGKSVVIDHGGGIYTQYYHLDRIDVKVGQKVLKGDKIGLSGATGRVSGPHLHFGVVVQNIQVDPLVFIEKFNSLF